jgi:DNA-binding NarL/FixJ family response regulator
MAPFRILIADDHEWVRRSVRTLLASCPGWEICGEAVDGRDTLKKARRLNPDLVLLDIGMPYLSGLEVARELLAHGCQPKILMITVNPNRHVAQESRDLGAHGFLSKTDAVRDLVPAIESLQRGETFFPELELTPAFQTAGAAASRSSGPKFVRSAQKPV